VKSFRQRVLDIVRRIPSGRTLFCGEVAMRAGSPRAARAVGTILKGNYDPEIPCHRVIRGDGGFGQYNRGARKKRELLKRERVI